MSEIHNLVQRMHDHLCRCGEWCSGAEDDHHDFVEYLERRWGSSAYLEWYLREVRDGD